MGAGDRETNKETHESGEGSPGVTGGASGKGVREDCLEEGAPSKSRKCFLVTQEPLLEDADQILLGAKGR